MSLLAAIGAGLDAVAKVFGYQTRRLELKNSAPMQQAATAQQEIAARDETKRAIARRDVERIRRELAE